MPLVVLDAYGLHDADLTPITSGWINETLLVERGPTRFVLQRLHPVFSGDVNQDIDVITRHLGRRGVLTPRIVPTHGGELWVAAERPWRMLTFVEGETLETLETLARARSAGAIVGRFHRALSDLEHTFAFTRPGAHDTVAHLAKLRAVSQNSQVADPAVPLARPLAEAILAYPRPPTAQDLPTRIIHGDLKATNLLFVGSDAVAILDLDTIAHGTIAVDLGDALRSWCNAAGESSPDARFDRETFEAAMAGYASSVQGWVTAEEVRAVVAATETIALELAARFATDVYEDRYFGFDPTRYPSRRAHNLARAEAQLALARSIGEQRHELLAFVDALWR